MLVYGDHAERVDPRRRLAELAECSGRWLSHDRLTDLFVDASALAQGIADAEFGQCGEDRHRPNEAALLSWLTALAATLLHSWGDGQCGGGVEPLPDLPNLPAEVRIKLAEGYAFYALRPEAIGLAARRLRLLAPPRVIGLRSIGTGLACMAAAALKAAPPVTLRPIGDPFDRRPNISAALGAELVTGDAHFVIVDEGPGLSGSSFGGVADWLEDRGVSPDHIAFLPSHDGGLGAQAQARHCARWAQAQRPTMPLDEPRRTGIETLVGPVTEWQDISGGRWRSFWSAAEDSWPAIDPMWERRKFLASTQDGRWLVKWAGFGQSADAKSRLAAMLAPFVPPVDLVEGWLVTSWHEASPTRPTLGELVDYLALRAQMPAATPGASLTMLVEMVRRNALPDWSPDVSTLRVRPVLTDNRMAAHEWLRTPAGQLLKADALDHHQGHDLIGCQDIAWDVAGAAVELDLSNAELEQLRTALTIEPRLLSFYLVAYRAFRLGAHQMSAASLDHWPEEQRRHLVMAEQHAAALAAVDTVENARDIV